MTSAYVLRVGKGKYALYLDRTSFSATRFSLTDEIDSALMLTHEEANQVAAQYHALGVDFVIEEIR